MGVLRATISPPRHLRFAALALATLLVQPAFGSDLGVRVDAFVGAGGWALTGMDATNVTFARCAERNIALRSIDMGQFIQGLGRREHMAAPRIFVMPDSVSDLVMRGVLPSRQPDLSHVTTSDRTHDATPSSALSALEGPTFYLSQNQLLEAIQPNESPPNIAFADTTTTIDVTAVTADIAKRMQNAFDLVATTTPTIEFPSVQFPPTEYLPIEPWRLWGTPATGPVDAPLPEIKFPNDDYMKMCGGQAVSDFKKPIIEDFKAPGGLIGGPACLDWRMGAKHCNMPFEDIAVTLFRPLPQPGHTNWLFRQDPKSFATTVALRNEADSVKCSGVLVDHDRVLTAAHCVCDAGFPASVAFGATAWEPKGSRVGEFYIERAVYGPSLLMDEAFCPRLRAWKGNEARVAAGLAPLSYPANDLALLTITELPTFADAFSVLPVEPFWNGEPYKQALASGYGIADQTSHTGRKHFTALLAAFTPCDTTAPEMPCAAAREFTATSLDPNGNADSCFADSGAPVFVDLGNEHRLAGIVSRGTTANAKDTCGAGGIYIDLRHPDVRAWLEAELDRT